MKDKEAIDAIFDLLYREDDGFLNSEKEWDSDGMAELAEIILKVRTWEGLPRGRTPMPRDLEAFDLRQSEVEDRP